MALPVLPRCSVSETAVPCFGGIYGRCQKFSMSCHTATVNPSRDRFLSPHNTSRLLRPCFPYGPSCTCEFCFLRKGTWLFSFTGFFKNLVSALKQARYPQDGVCGVHAGGSRAPNMSLIVPRTPGCCWKSRTGTEWGLSGYYVL